jgi:predicted dehydrogenase
LAEACRCSKTYPSLEELVKDDNIEAVFVATDAPSHARHCIEVLKHGKHVCCAVPATFGSLEEAEELYKTVKETGLNYMLMETSSFHDDLYAMRLLFQQGHFGRMLYTEGEYYHYMDVPIDSYKGWRIGLPPQYYPTHSNAYHTCVTGESFTEVSCMGIPSIIDHLKPENNIYKNPFGTEIAMFRTSGGGMSRMAVSWDTPGVGGEMGRVRGDKGTMYNGQFQGLTDIKGIELRKPPLPPTVDPGGHGGSHGYLSNEFVHSIIEKRQPLVNIKWALDMTVGGIVAHQSAMKDGELLKIPQFA